MEMLHCRRPQKATVSHYVQGVRRCIMQGGQTRWPLDK